MFWYVSCISQGVKKNVDRDQASKYTDIYWSWWWRASRGLGSRSILKFSSCWSVNHGNFNRCPWNQAPPAPVPLRLRDPNAVAEQQKDVTAWDFKDWISGCSLQYGIFGSFFLEINRKCRRHKEKQRKTSAVFEVDKWSFSVDVKLRFAAGFFWLSLALGHHPKPQHHWAGTVPMTKFGISIFAKQKQEKTSKKIWGSLDSRDSYPFSYRFCDSLGENRVFLGVGVLTGPVASHQGGYRNSQPVTSLASWELPCCFLPSQLSSD